jgi:hypothetical protein
MGAYGQSFNKSILPPAQLHEPIPLIVFGLVTASAAHALPIYLGDLVDVDAASIVRVDPATGTQALISMDALVNAPHATGAPSHCWFGPA